MSSSASSPSGRCSAGGGAGGGLFAGGVATRGGTAVKGGTAARGEAGFAAFFFACAFAFFFFAASFFPADWGGALGTAAAVAFTGKMETEGRSVMVSVAAGMALCSSSKESGGFFAARRRARAAIRRSKSVTSSPAPAISPPSRQ